jgi:hypothetical protein
MNRLRQFCATTILMFTLIFPTFAGEIATGVTQSSPPQQTESVTGEIATGIMATNDTPNTETTSFDPVTEFGLSILQSLLALF